MSDPNQPSAPPGWYPDGQGGQRWWDGTRWTEHTQPAAPQQQPQQGPQQPPAAPGVGSLDMPTVVAPDRAAAQPAQPSYGQQAYGQPGQGGPSFPPPGHPPYGMPAGPGGGGNKKTLVILGAVVGALVLVAAIGGILLVLQSGGGPEGVAKDYVRAQLNGDYEKACDLSSKDEQKSMEDAVDVSSCGAFAKKAEDESSDSSCQAEYGEDCSDINDDFDYDVKVTKASKDGDSKATVEMTVEQTYKGSNKKVKDTLEDEAKSRHLTCSLVKEGGDWKVSDTDGEDSGSSGSSSN